MRISSERCYPPGSETLWTSVCKKDLRKTFPPLSILASRTSSLLRYLKGKCQAQSEHLNTPCPRMLLQVSGEAKLWRGKSIAANNLYFLGGWGEPKKLGSTIKKRYLFSGGFHKAKRALGNPFWDPLLHKCLVDPSTTLKNCIDQCIDFDHRRR